MTKKLCLLLLIFFTILVSCTNQKEAISEHETPSGPSIALKIAVIGTNHIAAIDNVNYVKTSLQDLVEDDNQQLDGLIISKESFEEAAQEEYRDFFKNIKYPVFFLGAENILTAVFHEDGLTLEDGKIGGTGAYASGFVSTEDGYKDWGLYLPNNPTNNDKNINIIVRICNAIQEYKENEDTE
ncbi:hypothetical protein [Paenibacillus sp. IHBB 10380]|uniref:hypothetical protein n=1 Tax=Paenibacillus sp. IHBB 10380 TaxID=1566358 RepID=UPI0005CFB4F3|nr:hypothetical protein [Paenibacillus sp. IHBB 10380]AJS61170.1 hypothetical protein UB51_25115 [Paenibacillus sp. IHBB 10380]